MDLAVEERAALALLRGGSVGPPGVEVRDQPLAAFQDVEDRDRAVGPTTSMAASTLPSAAAAAPPRSRPFAGVRLLPDQQCLSGLLPGLSVDLQAGAPGGVLGRS